jgi:hypothetical protein
MKGLFALIACVLIFGTGWALGQQTSNFLANGSEWKAISLDGQIGYARGYNVGYTAGLLDGRALTLVPSPPEENPWKRWSGLDFRLLYPNARAHLAAVDALADRAPYVQLVNTISDMYRDFRNAPVCWNNAVVFSEESLAGYPPAESQLAEARTIGARGCQQ